MLKLLISLSGIALVESLNVLNLGVTSGIAYDSRLRRRSPLPGGLSFLAGLFAATLAVGIAVVLGVDLLTELTAFRMTPTLRYRGELVIGVVLVGVACFPSAAKRTSPGPAFAAMRQNPWLLGAPARHLDSARRRPTWCIWLPSQCSAPTIRGL